MVSSFTVCLVWKNMLGGIMNNGKDYNYQRGAWAMKHPPLKSGKLIGECRFPLRSWTHRHPPPSTMTGILRSVYLVVSGMQPTLKKQYVKNKNDDSPSSRWSCRFINKTNQKTRIWETLNAFPCTEGLETVRSV